MSLFYPNDSKLDLMGYADTSYLSNPHNGRSLDLMGYADTGSLSNPHNGQSLDLMGYADTGYLSDPHICSHVVAQKFHGDETSRECVWLRSIIQHVRQTCGLSLKNMKPTTIYEDNSACISQLKEGCIKGDITKHILPKLFFTHDLQRNGDVKIQNICSCENLADLFTKSLSRRTFEQLVHKIELHVDDVSLQEGKGKEIKDVKNNII